MPKRSIEQSEYVGLNVASFSGKEEGTEINHPASGNESVQDQSLDPAQEEGLRVLAQTDQDVHRARRSAANVQILSLMQASRERSGTKAEGVELLEGCKVNRLFKPVEASDGTRQDTLFGTSPEMSFPGSPNTRFLRRDCSQSMQRGEPLVAQGHSGERFSPKVAFVDPLVDPSHVPVEFWPEGASFALVSGQGMAVPRQEPVASPVITPQVPPIEGDMGALNSRVNSAQSKDATVGEPVVAQNTESYDTPLIRSMNSPGLRDVREDLPLGVLQGSAHAGIPGASPKVCKVPRTKVCKVPRTQVCMQVCKVPLT